jgi:hypothetical protein
VRHWRAWRVSPWTCDRLFTVEESVVAMLAAEHHARAEAGVAVPALNAVGV